MKGSETRLLMYMDGSQKRFVVPVYQRNYEWKKENCEQLFNDLIDVVRTGRKSHFFGSLVSSYHPNGHHIEYLVIDGQQRLTTVSLLLLAMYNLLQQGKVASQTSYLAQQILENFLIDKYQPKEKRIKLKPVKDDRAAFDRLFDVPEEHLRKSNLTANYDYFYNRIQKEEITVDELYDALFSLEVINIELTSEDNPQRIFESLNSTGVALSEGDKIRNFILMGLTSNQQEEYYEKYWNRIEILTDYNVSIFVRDYLSIKQQLIPAMDKVYTTFKAYVQERGLETESLLQELLAYAKRYEILLKGKTPDKQLNACIYRLNRLETTVTRPFFLEVLRLQSEGKLSWQEVREVFLYTENYLFRRTMCEMPTNALNKLFLMLHREIIRFEGNDENYVEKFKYALLNKGDRVRFPSDAEFIGALYDRPVYKMNSKNKIYIFERLENHGTVEDKDIYHHVDEGVYSIEHIMPQHLTPAWIKTLGEEYERVHDMWLHRLANLTLTGYNSKYSNSTFAEKRDMPNGFADSGLRLNAWIAQQSKWTEDELESRNKLLIDRALLIWGRPETSFVSAEKHMDSCSLDDDSVELRGRNIARFSYKNTEQPVSSWSNMMEQLLKILHTEDASVLTKLAYDHDPDNELSVYVSNNPKDLRNTLEIDNGLFVERNTSTNVKISMLRKFFKAYGANPEDLVFFLKDGTEDEQEDETGTRYELRRRYWAFALPLIRQAHGEGKSFSNSTSTKENWLSGWFGISGFSLMCVSNYNEARVELYLGKSDKDGNKEAYDYLFTKKSAIEAALGTELGWRRNDDGKSSQVIVKLPGVSIENETDWTQMAKFHAEWSKKFYDVFVPYLKEKY
ncbi:MAG: DUF4268 domain-containing protein [Clostridiales bacterium]|nr:DUF4268 domain-containing protein [Clostridiales bacterium]